MTTARFPSPDHQRLDILTGIWDTTITMLAADGAAGDISSATDSYAWMPNGHFLVHEVDAIMAGQHVQSTEIFAVDRDTGDFVSRSYDADGSTHDFRATIKDRDFSIIGTTQRFAGRFSPDGMVLEGQWNQHADGDWLPFVHIVLRKRG